MSWYEEEESELLLVLTNYHHSIMSSSSASMLIIRFFTLLLLIISTTRASKLHNINFRSPNLYPKALTYDPKAQHFLVGSLRSRSIHAVSDAGVVETLISSDPSLPPNSTVLGLAVDSLHHRLLAVVHSLPPFNALVSYDLRSRQQLFLSVLADDEIEQGEVARPVANDVAVDFAGNAYVTNSAGNFIWKVNAKGEASILSRSSVFSSHPVDRDAPYSECGLNGIAYISKGYLLVVQSNTGKMFKVDEEDGRARTVILNANLTLADGIAIRRDGVAVVVSQQKAWFLKSDDSWSEARVYDETALDVDGFATSVAVGGEDRVYVLYGHVMEGSEDGREQFRIEEIRSAKEGEDDHVWVFVLLGLGFAYFMFWRFQMGNLAKNMNKKIS